MYDRFASVYELLMDDFDYKSWALFYAEIIKRQGITLAGKKLIEVGAGSGLMTVELAKTGAQITASDLSPSMVELLQSKTRRYKNVTACVQDMTSFTAPYPADCVICACDGVNYLTREEDIKGFIKSAYKALKTGGVIAFDISSPYKLIEVTGSNVFYEDRDEVTYIWTNELNKTNSTINMSLTFFKPDGHGKYERFDERQTLRAYTKDDITTLLTHAGFTNICAYGDRHFNNINKNELRLHFTAVKPLE